MSKKILILLSVFGALIFLGAGCAKQVAIDPNQEVAVSPQPENIMPPKEEVSATEKTFQGNGFSFVYPAIYVADDKGLWTEGGYSAHINPPAVCDTCQIPEIEIKSAASNASLDQKIIADFGLSGASLKEMSAKTGILYEEVNIGKNTFVKISVSENFDITGYYAKSGNTIVGFRVYQEDKDNEILKNILSTLKFEQAGAAGTPAAKNVEMNKQFILNISDTAKLGYDTPGSRIDYLVTLKSITKVNGVLQARVSISGKEIAENGGQQLVIWPEQTFSVFDSGLNKNAPDYHGFGLFLVSLTEDGAVLEGGVGAF